MDDNLSIIWIEKIQLFYLQSLSLAILSGVASDFLAAALWTSANHLFIWLIVTIFFAAFCVVIILKIFSFGLASAAISRHSNFRYQKMITVWLALDPMIMVLRTLDHQKTF